MTPKITLDVKTVCHQPLRVRCSSRDADGKASIARDKLEEELTGLERQLSEEVDLRTKEATEFAARLKEVNTLFFYPPPPL